MKLKTAYLALSILPVIFSCSLSIPGTGNNLSSIATKAEALKYFECALNNPNLTESQKNTIKTTVIAQLNLIPDATWEKAKGQFETFAKTFGCDKPSASPSPSASASPSSSASPSTNITAEGIFKNKEEYIKFLNCAYNNLKERQLADKKDSSLVLSGIEVMAELNASRFLDDKTFNQQKNRFDALGTKYKSFCPDPNATPSPLPSLTPVSTKNGFSGYSCDAEKSLKSASGASINVTFANNSGKKVKVYWLDFNSKRKIYNSSLNNGVSMVQQTYITHPWLITDENDKCLKILVPSDLSANKSTVSI